MGVIANLLGWTLRAIAYFVGREKVIRYVMNLAEKNGSPQIADAIRSKYFEMYGEVLRPFTQARRRQK